MRRTRDASGTFILITLLLDTFGIGEVVREGGYLERVRRVLSGWAAAS